ncbi:AMP-binding protein [Ramlibacter sp. MAH-25]|uniref:AMP-binding protein n=2 Tax=Comamonadaceae TaxID=80864 RepID=A0A6N8J1I2_9BURK|nr:AMP-binding protein [Ramlibacter sp. CGMCC 1.13660]MVQ32143.1 AMP-binding protein [Ramlibacter pinisoli]
MHAAFRWSVPAQFNIAQVCCTRWAERPDGADRIAIRAHGAAGNGRVLTFGALQAQANRLSRVLAGLGVQRGDRVALVMPQRFETAIAYMAIFQLGAIAMPLSMLFGPEALDYRLRDSEAVVALVDESSIANILAVRANCPALRTIVGVDAAALQADLDWGGELARQPSTFAAVPTQADEGAVLIYTSGTTGPPKGALIPHRALIGNLPGFVCSQNWFGFDPTLSASRVDGTPTPVTPSPARGREGEGAGVKPWQAPSAGDDQNTAVFWSPADWAWTGGLMDALLPSLYFGRPIVAYNGRFAPETAFALLQEHGVTHTFLFPTALKAMMKAYPEPRRQFRLKLQAIMSAGEAVGDAVFAYCRDQLGVAVNEMFGQTEINYVVGNCSMTWAPTLPASRGALPPEGAQPALGRPGGRLTAFTGAVGWPARPGSMGRPYPGHRVAVIDDDGNECPVGVPGDVAVNRYDVHGDPDPIFFLGYWRNEAATRRKSTGDWCRTGDLATRDADGYLWYQGRADDVFKAAGYRIGPSEIENCLVKHPAVANAAVVPKPDRERGALVKAYIVLAPGHRPGDELVAELQQHVRGKLAPYEYPKEIEFIEALPMTTTGKVQRRVLRLQEEERARAAG